MSKDIINHLEELGLIRYIHESVYDFGENGGSKKVFCAVNRTSDIMEQDD